MKIQWKLDDVPPQAGRRYLITGGNSGIGYYAAVELVRRGAAVILACRDQAKGEAAVRLLRAETGASADAVELLLLDLASLESVRQVSDSLLARGMNFDSLINNAGVMAPPKRKLTKDGFELQFGTNVLGHFALTCRLLPIVTGRVVTLASIAHKRGRIHFDDLQSEKSYSPMGAYQQSKLGDLMFALELERRLRVPGSPVASICVHPGVAQTKLFKVGSSEGLAATAESLLQRMLGILFGSGLDGALPTIFAATSPEAHGGAYYGPQGFQEMRGGDVGTAFVSKAAQDIAAQERLWTVCASLTGVDFGA